MEYTAITLLTISVSTLIVYVVSNKLFSVRIQWKPLFWCAGCALFISIVLPRIVVGTLGITATLILLAVCAILFAYFIAYHYDMEHANQTQSTTEPALPEPDYGKVPAAATATPPVPVLSSAASISAQPQVLEPAGLAVCKEADKSSMSPVYSASPIVKKKETVHLKPGTQEPLPNSTALAKAVRQQETKPTIVPTKAVPAAMPTKKVQPPPAVSLAKPPAAAVLAKPTKPNLSTTKPSLKPTLNKPLEVPPKPAVAAATTTKPTNVVALPIKAPLVAAEPAKKQATSKTAAPSRQPEPAALVAVTAESAPAIKMGEQRQPQPAIPPVVAADVKTPAAQALNQPVTASQEIVPLPEKGVEQVSTDTVAMALKEPKPQESPLKPSISPALAKRISTITDLDNLLDIAFEQKEEKNAAGALLVFRRALQLYPDSDAAPFLVMEIGTLLKNLGAYDEAIQVFADGRNTTALKQDATLDQEFISTIAYLRIIKNILLDHRLGLMPFAAIPDPIMKEIEAEFREWRNLA